MTALRVTPPSWAGDLAGAQSLAHSFFSNSTRSSVQDIRISRCSAAGDSEFHPRAPSAPQDDANA